MKNNNEKDIIIINRNNHSKFLSSTSTCDSCKSSNTYNFNKKQKSIINDNNFGKNDNLIEDIDIIIENENELNESNSYNNTNKTKVENKKSVQIINKINLFNQKLAGMNKFLSKSQSLSIYKQMKPDYIEKNEIPFKTIEYYSKNKIKLIDINLLLKKVAEDSFREEEKKVLYSFIKQSFSFINIEIFLKKIINCYEYHKSLDEFNQQVHNLVVFLNAYIIEMMSYNKSIMSDDNIFGIINSFYINLKQDIMKIKKYQKLSKIKNEEIKNRLLNETICTKIKDKNGEKIRWWTKELVKKKLKNHHRLNIIKYQKLIEKEKNDKKNKNKIEDSNNNCILPNKNEIKEIQQKKKLPRLSLTNNSYSSDILKDWEILDKNSTILHPSNSKDSLFKTNEKKHKKEKLNDEQLIKILGNKYEDMIKNKELIITKEENFLLLLKNITKLLKQKSYSEEVILKTKSRENFYAKLFNLKNKEDIKKKKIFQKNEIINNISLNFNKTITNVLSFPPNKKNYFCVTDYNIEQIGEQLISITKNLLNKIEPKELYRAVFIKNEKYIKSPNVMKSIQKFNNLVLFIIEDILSYDTPKERAKIFDQWALIAKYCKNRKDQSDCLAIHSALNNYIITDLNQTINSIKSGTKTILKEIGNYCTLESNYKHFRDEINNITKDEYYLPYLGRILKEVNFWEEKGKYIIQGNMISFEKIENVGNILDSFFDFKNRSDSIKYETIKELNFFEELGEKKEEELEKIANNLEPEFKLGEIKEGIKRLTDIDIKYFCSGDKKE